VKRRRVAYSSLISLLDVLFILVFASLIQGSGRLEATRAEALTAAEPAEEPAVPAEPTPPPPDAGVPPAPDNAQLRAAAQRALARAITARRTHVVRVSADGIITAIERDNGGTITTVKQSIKLLLAVDDPDVVLIYVGDRDADMSICAIAIAELGAAVLARDVIVVVPAVPFRALPVALVAGLRRDIGRCVREHGGLIVLVDPATQETWTP